MRPPMGIKARQFATTTHGLKPVSAIKKPAKARLQRAVTTGESAFQRSFLCQTVNSFTGTSRLSSLDTHGAYDTIVEDNDERFRDTLFPKRCPRPD